MLLLATDELLAVRVPAFEAQRRPGAPGRDAFDLFGSATRCHVELVFAYKPHNSRL